MGVGLPDHGRSGMPAPDFVGRDHIVRTDQRVIHPRQRIGHLKSKLPTPQTPLGYQLRNTAGRLRTYADTRD